MAWYVRGYEAGHWDASVFDLKGIGGAGGAHLAEKGIFTKADLVGRYISNPLVGLFVLLR